MSKTKVFNKEELAKAEKIKGSARNSIAYDLVHNFKSAVFQDKKRKNIDNKKSHIQDSSKA